MWLRQGEFRQQISLKNLELYGNLGYIANVDLSGLENKMHFCFFDHRLEQGWSLHQALDLSIILGHSQAYRPVSAFYGGSGLFL